MTLAERAFCADNDGNVERVNALRPLTTIACKEAPMATEQDTKTCKDCGESKPLSSYFRHGSHRSARCTVCDKALAKAARILARLKRVVRSDGERACADCREIKPRTLFAPNRMMADGRASYCKDCQNRRGRAWRASAIAKPEFRAARQLSQVKLRAKRYGLSVDALLVLEAKSEGLCDICGNPAKGRNGSRTDSRLHVDHCHTTGKVRGLLCGDCNRGIGIFQDRPDWLRTAAAYLEGK